jgi:hypothetical protein
MKGVLPAVALAFASSGAIAGNYCVVTAAATDCRYPTREACERDLQDVRDRCIVNPEILVQPPPAHIGPLQPGKVTTLPPDPPLSGSTPSLQDTWRVGIDVGQQLREDQLRETVHPTTTFGVPVPSSRYVVLYRCTAPDGTTTYASSGGPGCVVINVQAY